MSNPNEWTSITRWFHPLTNRIKVKILAVLSGLNEENSSLDIKIYDSITLAKTIRETQKKTEEYCRTLLEANLLISPNHGFIKGQRGYRKKTKILPEVQLSKEGIIAAQMIHQIRFHLENNEIIKTSKSTELLQFLGQLEQPLQQLHTLIHDKQQEMK